MKESEKIKTEKQNKNKSLRKVFVNNFYILKIVWKVYPKRVIADFFMSAIDYFSWVFYTIVFIKYILAAIQYQQSLWRDCYVCDWYYYSIFSIIILF